MSVNLSFQLNDKQRVIDTALAVFNRRKQLVEWPLSRDDMIDVQHLPHTATVIRELLDTVPRALSWMNDGVLEIPDSKHPHKRLLVHLLVAPSIPVANSTYGSFEPHPYVPCAATEATERLRQWAWIATTIELENRWAMRIIRQLVGKATTHQQVHRYMPEIYAILVNQEKSLGRRRPGRFEELDEELRRLGSARATKLLLDEVSLMDRSKLKKLVAQVLMLPPVQSMEVGSGFERTWITV